MDEDKEVKVIIETMPCFDDNDELWFEKVYVTVNGESIETNGNHLQAILEYLGYEADVQYY